MLINPFSGVVNSALSGASNKGVTRLQNAVSQLSSGEKLQRAADDVSALSVAKGLQNETTELRSALSNTAQLSSLLQVAGNDIQQVQSALVKLKELAVSSASGAANNDNRALFDQEFQSVIAEITRAVQSSTFGGAAILNGSLSGENSIDLSGVLGDGSGEPALSIEALDAVSLLGQGLNIRTKEDATQAIDAIQQAFNIVGTAQASVGAFSEQLEYATAYIETAIVNQDAARSVLEDADFTEAASALSIANIKQQAEVAIEVQVKRLPPSMLQQLIY